MAVELTQRSRAFVQRLSGALLLRTIDIQTPLNASDQPTGFLLDGLARIKWSTLANERPYRLHTFLHQQPLPRR